MAEQTLYCDDDIIAPYDNFIQYIMRVDGIDDDEARVAFSENLKSGFIRVYTEGGR